MIHKSLDEDQLIPLELLQKADKILFVTHLAIGDFAYMQNYFKALHEKYPHIKIDLWVDEVRRTWKFWKWNSFKKYVLHDWLNECSFFNKIYRNTYTPILFKKSIKEAQQESYPIVVSFAQIRTAYYASLSRKLSPKGFVAGMVKDFEAYRFLKKYNCRKLNAKIIIKSQARNNVVQISDVYALWFEKLFDVIVEKKERFPFLSFPKKWSYYGKLKFLYWGIHKKENEMQKTIFLNSFAKNGKRCWPIDNVVELIHLLKKTEGFYNAIFIINVMPNDYKYYKNLFTFDSKRIFVFSADVNFFQLPAIISCCDLVISVETSVIHLAAALKIPVIALMRQKNPEWAPPGDRVELIYVKKKRDWINRISVDDVSKKTISFFG